MFADLKKKKKKKSKSVEVSSGGGSYKRGGELTLWIG
jgi:hypothetical protein